MAAQSRRERLGFVPTPGGVKCVECGKRAFVAVMGAFYCLDHHEGKADEEADR